LIAPVLPPAELWEATGRDQIPEQLRPALAENLGQPARPQLGAQGEQRRRKLVSDRFAVRHLPSARQ